MSSKISRHNRGIAVVMAMSVVLLLFTVALELHMSERVHVFTSASARDRLTVEQMAESGINMAMLILVKDRLDSESDSLQEDWADEEAVAAHLVEIPFEQGQLAVKITDEIGKIQINALVQFPEGREFNPVQQRLWERFAGGLTEAVEEVGETDTITIINSIKDWLDSGDDDAITGLSGAESDYYRELDPPYACKNAPFDHLSEVRLVKGITPELLASMGGPAVLGNYLTVYGGVSEAGKGLNFPGQININTADLSVLKAIMPLEAAEMAELIVDYRQATSGSKFTNDISTKNWYKNVPGLSELNLDDLVTVKSDFFRITAKATLDKMQSTATVIVQRVKTAESGRWTCKVLNWNNG